VTYCLNCKFHNAALFQKRKTTSLVLEFANKIYLEHGFELVPEYKQTLIKDFLSDIEATNFLKPEQAASQINSWMSNVTHNRVNSLIMPGRACRSVWV
jgi:serine protease inhibitor